MPVHVGLTLPVIHSSGKKRWNFRKANWDKFSVFTETRSSADAEIEDTPSREYACKASCEKPEIAVTLGLQQGQRRLVLAPANYLTSEVWTTDQP